MADEEAFLVVVGVDEPAGDTFGSITADFAGIGVEYINTVDLYLDLAIGGIDDINVRLTENDEQIAFAGVLEIVGHV